MIRNDSKFKTINAIPATITDSKTYLLSYNLNYLPHTLD
jgi:hypothetical protein